MKIVHHLIKYSNNRLNIPITDQIFQFEFEAKFESEPTLEVSIALWCDVAKFAELL